MQNILIVTNSKKKSFKTESNILDKYCIRVARTVWKCSLHEKTLKTIISLLKRVASKNTNIVFFKDNKEFLFIGNKKKFSIKNKKTVKTFNEISAKWHDLGKKSLIFQEMIIKTTNNEEDRYSEYFIRHEYLSVLFIEYFILKNKLLNDKNYLENFLNLKKIFNSFEEYVEYRINNFKYFSIFKEDSSLFDFLFIIGTHHKLPNLYDNYLSNSNFIINDRNFVFNKISISLTKYEEDILKKDINIVSNLYSFNIFNLIKERILLLFADANGSSMKIQQKLKIEQIEQKYNEKEKAKTFDKNISPIHNSFQTFKEHTNSVILFSKKINKLIKENPFSTWIYENKDFIFEETDLNKFKWQFSTINYVNKHFNKNIPTLSFLGSSTGSGKTRFGFKLHSLISKKKRLTVLNGLRTLTLQSGSAYKDFGLLNESDISVLIGDNAVKKIYDSEIIEEDNSEFEMLDSSSKRNNTLLNYFEEGFLDINKERFLDSPVLICTLDYIFQATKFNKQRHIFSNIRISTSDILIDEIDNFDKESQESLLNLIFLIGFYRSNLTISTATIYPEFAEKIYKAYLSGIKISGSSRFNTFYLSDFENYFLQEKEFDFKKFFENVGKNRRYILKNKIEIRDITEDNILDTILELHTNEHENYLEKEFSIGFIRIAQIKNIKNIINILLEKIEKESFTDIDIEIIGYHSQMTLLERTFLEKELDLLLNRKKEKLFEKDFFKNKNLKKKNIVIVVASPVEEVGRDHDFDWEICEPTSFGTTIQSTGRVFRHRERNSNKTNIIIMNKNFKLQNFEINRNEIGLCYVNPGLETKEMEFIVDNKKDFSELIKNEEVQYLQTNKNIYNSRKNSLPFFERKVIENTIKFNEVFQKKEQIKYFLTENGEFQKKNLRKKTKTINGYIDNKGKIFVLNGKIPVKINIEYIDIFYDKINTFFNSYKFQEFKNKFLRTNEDYIRYNKFSIPFYGEGDFPKIIYIYKNLLIEAGR